MMWDEQSLPWQVVDSGPCSAIITGLPTIFLRFAREVAMLVVQLFSFIFSGSFFTLSLVGLGQIDVVRHTTIANTQKSKLRSVQGVHEA